VRTDSIDSATLKTPAIRSRTRPMVQDGTPAAVLSSSQRPTSARCAEPSFGGRPLRCMSFRPSAHRAL